MSPGPGCTLRVAEPIRPRWALTAASLAALALVCAACAEPDPVEPPNIVLLIGDDHGYPYFGFTGNETVRTPHLDRLAAEGTVFLQAFSASNVCRPSLWTLLTGLQPYQVHAIAADRASEEMQTGPAGRRQWARWNRLYSQVVGDDPDNLPRALARAGYTSFQAGKFWEGDFASSGFSEGTSELDRGASVHQVRQSARQHGRLMIEPVLDFIDRNREGRFLVWYSPMIPHRPHMPPPEILESYADPKLSAREMSYYAMCTWFDQGVGRILELLERTGLRDRTLVVYLSDNGWDHEARLDSSEASWGAAGKLSHDEYAFRTPVIMSWPGHVPSGRVRHDVISSADIFPTLLAYAGIDAPASRLGLDLRALLSDGEPLERDDVIGSTTFIGLASPDPSRDPESAPRISGHGSHWSRENVFYLTNSRWHYVYNESRGQEWLYERRDVSEPPRDRIGDEPDLAREYRARIEAWKAEAVARVRMPR